MSSQFDEHVDVLRKVLEDIRDELTTEHDIAGTTEVPVDVDGCRVGYADVEFEIKRSLEAISKDTIPDALDLIEDQIDALVALCKPLVEGMAAAKRLIELVAPAASTAPGQAAPVTEPATEVSVPATTPVTVADAREPWPAEGLTGDTQLAKNYPAKYQPPGGYDWTGEFRKPTGREWFVANNRRVLQNSGSVASPRPILRKLNEGERPSYGLSAAAARKPWPGTSGANAVDPTRKEFAAEYEPPTGWAYDEFEAPMEGTAFLNSSGHVEVADYDWDYNDARHILVPLPDTAWPNEAVAIPAAVDVPTTPAPSQFEPPKTPNPV